MKKNRTEEELIEHFTLLPNERHLVMGNKTEVNRLGFAVLLKYFQQEAKFPSKKQDISKVVLDYIAKQLDFPLIIRTYLGLPPYSNNDNKRISDTWNTIRPALSMQKL